MTWKIESDYFENCNCEVLCPCITTPDNHGEYERCQVPLICRIVAGHYEDLSLDGLNFAIVADTPGAMSLGNWNVAYYIDERADDRQRTALETIVTGKAGGVPEALAAAVGTTLGIKYVPFTVQGEGTRWSASIPGVLDVEIEGIVIPGHEDVLMIDTSPTRWVAVCRSPRRSGASSATSASPGTTPARTVTTRGSCGRAEPRPRAESN